MRATATRSTAMTFVSKIACPDSFDIRGWKEHHAPMGQLPAVGRDLDDDSDELVRTVSLETATPNLATIMAIANTSKAPKKKSSS
jgi:hypothetical protein